MPNYDHEISSLNREIAQILNDAEHFIRDLKGQRKVKGLVKKDVRQLRDHVTRLVEHLEELKALKISA